MKKYPFVSIIICTHNRVEALKKFALKSVLKLNYPNYEVIVVDDASTDKTQNILEKFKSKTKNFKVVKNAKMKGLCYTRNLGVEHSRGEIIAFTDDDCVVDKNWLKELVKPYLKNKKVMVVGGKTYVGNSEKVFNPNKSIFGCNMSFRKEIFKKFLFDNNLYFNKCSYYDETDLIYRIKNKNLKIVYTGKAIVKHFEQQAEYKANVKIGSPLNRIYIYAKKISLVKYYALFLVTLLVGKRKKSRYKTDIKELMIGFDGIRGLLNPKHRTFFKLPWIFYVLLIELPFKAKVKNCLEERNWRNSML